MTLWQPAPRQSGRPRTAIYKGATYHGTIQLLVDPVGRWMSGRWLGFGQNFRINTGEWELTWVEGSIAKNVQRLYHRRA